jgi:hypothetical protein
VRRSSITLGVAAVVVLASAASAPAQEEQYVAPPLGQGSGEQPLGPQSAPAPGNGAESTPALTQQGGRTQAEPAQTDTQTETDEAQTETDQAQTETTQEEPQEPDAPGQYCDPLAEEGCEEGRNRSNGQTGDEPSQTDSGTVAPATTVGGELANTGAPLGMLALVGSALVGAGAALRRLSRDGGAD